MNRGRVFFFPCPQGFQRLLNCPAPLPLFLCRIVSLINNSHAGAPRRKIIPHLALGSYPVCRGHGANNRLRRSRMAPSTERGRKPGAAAQLAGMQRPRSERKGDFWPPSGAQGWDLGTRVPWTPSAAGKCEFIEFLFSGCNSRPDPRNHGITESEGQRNVRSQNHGIMES